MLLGIEKVQCQSQRFVYFYFYFLRMHTCERNPPDACDPKTVNKYFNGPYLGYFLLELYENLNIASFLDDIK